MKANKTFNYQAPEVELANFRLELICQSSSIDDLIEENPGMEWE